MMPLSAAKSEIVAAIFAAAPSEALQRLELVLTRAKAADSGFEPVHALAAAEVGRRRIVFEVFEPLVPLTVRAALPKIARLTQGQLNTAWRAVAAADPDLAGRVEAAVKTYRRHGPPPVLDEACLLAAELTGERDPDLHRLLRLAPVLRRVQEKLDLWTRNVSGESIAAIRLAFKDALIVDEDAGPVFWEAIFAMLNQPWQVIRLISAAIDRPSDRYLAASELGPMGERLLDDIDRRIVSLKNFDPDLGEAGGAAEAASVVIAVHQITEFEEWLALNRGGPWGQRIAEQKKALALSMEARLRETEPAVAQALPTQPARGAGRTVRPAPKLVADPQPLVVNRADALLTLAEEARSAANAGGFAALRSSTWESLEKRLEQYSEDLLELLHRGEGDEPERMRAYLEIAARFTALVKGPEMAQIIRRRAAAA